MAQSKWIAALVLIIAATNPAISDETIRTTDGRYFLLRSDGTYTQTSAIEASTFAEAIATATTYGENKARIVTCLRDEPDGSEKMQSYFENDEQKTRLSWLASGGVPAEWDQIETALRKGPAEATADCAAVIDGWARLERFSWPLSQRSPFAEMNR